MAPPWFDRWIRVHGADLSGGATIVQDTANFIEVKFNHPPEWQSDPFLDPADRTKITIPRKLAGRYYVRVTIRWEKTDNYEFQIPDRDNSCFYTYLTKNGDTITHRLSETRISAAPVVNSTKTVMHVLWEGNLRKDDFIKLFISHPGTVLSASNMTIPVMANVWLTLRRLGPLV